MHRGATARAPARCRVRSPFSSVTPALSIATSVPVPMAMPTSAAASAGASLTPSPAMATTRPSRRSRSTTSRLVLGQHLGLDLGDAEPPRDRLRGGAVVAGQHDDAQCRPRRAPRAPRGVVALTGSAMAITPASLPSTATKIAVAPSPRSRSASASSAAVAMPSSARKLRVAERRCAGARPCRSRPCRPANRSRSTRAERDAALGRRRDDRRRQRMLAARARRWRRGAAPRLRRSRAPARWRRPSACLRSACRSCRPPACRPSPCAPAPRHS